MSQAPTMGVFTPAPAESHFGQPNQPPPLPQAPAEPVATGLRRLTPMHLAAIGGAVALAAVGVVTWVVLGSGDPVAETVAAPATGARPGASASAPSPTVSGLAPALLATRNPFGGASSGTGAPGTNPTSQSGGAGSTVTSTVTQLVSVTVPVTSTVTATRSVTTTATVTANPLYVFFVDWDGSGQAQLVVNDADQVAVTGGSSVSGVTYVGRDPAASNECVQVKRVGAADASAQSVCRGQAVKLG
jgi:hypothetical protein